MIMRVTHKTFQMIPTTTQSTFTKKVIEEMANLSGTRSNILFKRKGKSWTQITKKYKLK